MSRRNSNKLSFKKLTPIYLFVEGEKTERFYFELLRDKLSISGLRIYPTKGKTGSALLDKAKSKIKLGGLDESAIKYLVFDKDKLDKQEFNYVFNKASKEGFKIGFSNLNIEVWLLAHFEELQNRPTSLSDKVMLESKLTQHLNQKYQKGDRKQLEKIILYYKLAIENAKVINKEDFHYQCTTVGGMIERILNIQNKNSN